MQGSWGEHPRVHTHTRAQKTCVRCQLQPLNTHNTMYHPLKLLLLTKAATALDIPHLATRLATTYARSLDARPILTKSATAAVIFGASDACARARRAEG